MAVLRLRSLDIARGLVMVLMAVDHVRVYAGVPPGGPTEGVFFTRWVTHFCAPVFVFLAGTAAYLYGRRLIEQSVKVDDARQALARFLVTRGLCLILLELTVLRFGWTFNFDYTHFTFAGVIWAIGWSMVVLAGLCYLPLRAITAVGLITVFLHNAAGPTMFAIESPPWWLRVLYTGGMFPVGGEAGWNVAVLYSLIPWIGVMALGYAYGALLIRAPESRRRWSFTLGLGAVALFLLLRWTGVYGDQRPWEAQDGMPALLAFLNTSKYPASLQYLLMTLGPLLLALPLLERMQGRIASWLEVFGRVPFFYYVLHIPLIHLLALGIAYLRAPESIGWLIANHPMLPPEVPSGYRWDLGLLYLVTIVVVVVLYFPCRWYAHRKHEPATRRWWMAYL